MSNDLEKMRERAAKARELKSETTIEIEPLDMSRWDPVEIADRFIRNEMTYEDGESILRRWRGNWYVWDDDGFYTEASDEEIDIQLYQRLKLKKRNNVADVRHALPSIPGVFINRTDLGSWIGDAPTNMHPLDVASTRGGILNLITGELTPPTPRYFSTTGLGVRYDAAAPVPTKWLGFLRQLWPDDDESIAALQEWFGYQLTPDTRQQKMLLLVGPKRSGKGTIMRVLTELLGQASVAAPTLAALGTNFGLWPLIGKSSAIIGDARLSNRSDISQIVERLLSVSGQDALTIDRKHREPWTGYLSTRISIVSNELPRFNDDSGALASRFVTLELMTSWLGKENTGLTDELTAEMPGILNWAIEGWRRLRSRGSFTMPASTMRMNESLEDLGSPTKAWLRARTELTDDVSRFVPVDVAYRDYTSWRSQNGLPQESKETMGRNVRAANGCASVQVRRDGQKPYVYKGLAMRTN